MTVASIKDAVATLRRGDEWESKLTLVPAPLIPQSAHEGPSSAEEVSQPLRPSNLDGNIDYSRASLDAQTMQGCRKNRWEQSMASRWRARLC